MTYNKVVVKIIDLLTLEVIAGIRCESERSQVQVSRSSADSNAGVLADLKRIGRNLCAAWQWR